jgi:hypothetical protein
LLASGYTGNGILEVADYNPSDASLISSFSYSGESTVFIDVTSFLNSHISQNDPFQFAGFLLAMEQTSAGPFVQFGSTDFGSIFPMLTIELAPVPLPAALPLFGTGLGILGFMGWRRRRKAAAAV